MLPGWMSDWWWWEGGSGLTTLPPPVKLAPVLPISNSPASSAVRRAPRRPRTVHASRGVPTARWIREKQNYCGLGFDAATFDPNNPAKLSCIGGAKPGSGERHPGLPDQLAILQCPFCPSGYAKQDMPGIGSLCVTTAQQQQCAPGQQIGNIDNKCHALCLGTAWPTSQCCAAGSVVSVTGKCCPAGSTPDQKDSGTCGARRRAASPIN